MGLKILNFNIVFGFQKNYVMSTESHLNVKQNVNPDTADLLKLL